jgi:hypothetical protein
VNDVVITIMFAVFLVGWGVKANKIVKKTTGQIKRYQYKEWPDSEYMEGQALPSYYSLKVRNIQSLVVKKGTKKGDKP